MISSRHRNPTVAVISFTLVLLMAGAAHAASLQKLTQSDWWGGVSGLPSYVNMYIYVPDKLAAKPPIVVGPHHCGGTGQSSYSEMSALVSVADKNGFIMIFPEATGQNCWDAGSDRSLKHDGKGDTHAVAQMVRYTLSKYSGDASRVYSIGTSSGGIMTEALLGVYPDIFMAGVSIMGVPCGCWAEGYNDVTGKPASGTGQWSGPCAGGTVTKTAQQWGDLVRSYFPGYTGHRPRVQHWHGTADTTLSYKNLAESAKEWSNVLGLSETPTGSDTPKSGTTRQFWKNACGYTVLETFSVSGAGHTVGIDGPGVTTYFGLDKAADPEAAACPGAGNGGAGGASGSGGSSGTGGASAGKDGGPDGADARVPGAGGAQGSGGSASSGGAVGGGGGSSGSGGTVGGGASAAGGASARGGTSGSGGAAGTGGALASGGISARGGSAGQASGGAVAMGGQANPGTGGASAGAAGSPSGCNLGGRGGGSRVGISGLLLVVVGLVFRRPKRRRLVIQ